MSLETIVWCLLVLTVLRVGAGLSLLASAKYPRNVERTEGVELTFLVGRVAIAIWCAWVLFA